MVFDALNKERERVYLFEFKVELVKFLRVYKLTLFNYFI
jgi:hypothetical protein